MLVKDQARNRVFSPACQGGLVDSLLSGEKGKQIVISNADPAVHAVRLKSHLFANVYFSRVSRFTLHA